MKREFQTPLSILFLRGGLTDLFTSPEQEMFLKVKGDVGTRERAYPTTNTVLAQIPGRTKNSDLEDTYNRIKNSVNVIIFNISDFKENEDLDEAVAIIKYATSQNAKTYIICDHLISEQWTKRLYMLGVRIILTAQPEELLERSFFRMLIGYIAADIRASIQSFTDETKPQ